MTERRWLTDIRIVWAITAKDVLEAVRNRTTLGVLLSILFLIGAYRMLPALEGRARPVLLVYDAGQSRLVPALEDGGVFQVWSGYRSENEMKQKLADGDVLELGLVLPADLDRSVADGRNAELQGYLVSWVSAAEAEHLRQRAEAHVSELMGAPVRIRTQGNVVYPRPDSLGIGLPTGLGMCFAMLMVGISLVPNLMLEEKQSRTIHALLVSPAGARHVTAGKALTGLFYSLLAVAMAFALNHRVVLQPWLALLAALCGSLFTVALGLLLGTWMETRQQLQVWTWIVVVPLFVPALLTLARGLLPDWLMGLLGWTPAVALFRALLVSFSNQPAFSLYGPQLALVLAYALALLALVAWRLRRADR